MALPWSVKREWLFFDFDMVGFLHEHAPSILDFADWMPRENSAFEKPMGCCVVLSVLGETCELVVRACGHFSLYLLFFKGCPSLLIKKMKINKEI